MKYLNVLDENTEIKFDGSWLNGFINEMNSKEDLLNSLKAMPQNLRLNGKDWNGALIIHCWYLLNRKELSERYVLDLILKEKNCFAKTGYNNTVLHFACETDKLELVKGALRLGDSMKKEIMGKIPPDKTNNQDITQFLSDFKNSGSISFD